MKCGERTKTKRQKKNGVPNMCKTDQFSVTWCQSKRVVTSNVCVCVCVCEPHSLNQWRKKNATENRSQFGTALSAECWWQLQLINQWLDKVKDFKTSWDAFQNFTKPLITNGTPHLILYTYLYSICVLNTIYAHVHSFYVCKILSIDRWHQNERSSILTSVDFEIVK